MFNICSDDKIPFAREAFFNVGNVTYRKGNRLTSADLKGVDVLLIRSGTKVDSSLLGGTPVKFVASATAGTDHVDKDYLREAGIPFYHAPGCNAGSVVEYITAALFSMAERQNVVLEGKCIGILGAGNVGGRLARRIEALGMKVLVCDPPLLEADPQAASRLTFVELDEMVQEADILSLHVPLTRTGKHPTFHLFDEDRILSMKQGAWLLNASRGAVISNEALKTVSRKGHLGAVVLDVWEGEPAIDSELLHLVDIGTAHIAGYSYEGKVNGTIMVYDAFMEHFGLDPTWDAEEILAPTPGDHLDLQLPSSIVNSHQAVLSHLVQQMYDIEEDNQLLKESLAVPSDERAEFFLNLRKQYRRRSTFTRHTVSGALQVDAALETKITKGLGIRLVS